MKGKPVSKTTKEIIINLILEGKKYDYIIEHFNVSKSFISMLLKENNITYVPPDKKQYNYELVNNLLKLGKSPVDISRELCIPTPSLQSIYRSLGYSFKIDQGNTRYFQNIDTGIKAYLLGFIAADGYIVKSGNNTQVFGIQLNLIDEEIIHLLHKEIGNKNKIVYPGNNTMIRFSLANSDLVNDLYNLGITQRKSKTIGNILKNIPYEFHKDFIAGYFDGDGSVTVSPKELITTTHISFRGTKELLHPFIETIGLTNYYFFYNKTWILSFAKKEEVYKFYLLYKSASHKLDRKIKKLETGINKILLKYPKVQTISSPSLNNKT